MEKKELLELDQLLAQLENLRSAQGEIERSQQLYAELFEQAPVAYVNLTRRGRIHSANNAAAALLGWPVPINRGIPFQTYVASSDQWKFGVHLHGCSGADGEEVVSEIALRTVRNEWVYVEMRSRASKMLGDAEVIYRTVLHNITERKIAEKALAEGETSLRAIVEQTTAGIARAELDGTLTFTNSQFCKMLGYAEGELLGMNVKRLTVEEDPKGLERALRRLGAKGVAFQARERLVRRDGGWIWATMNVSALANAGGKPESLVLIAIDVSDWVQAEEALATSREEFRLVVDNVREYAIFSADMELRVTSWNTGAERLLGYKEQEILGKQADVIFTEEDREAGLPALEARAALAEGRATDDRWHVRKDGSQFWGSGVMMPMHDAAGRKVGFVKIFRDETEIRAARQEIDRSRERLWHALQEAERAREEAEAAGQAKDHFLAVLSHELRTPLTPIFMMTHMLARQKDLPEPLREAVEMIQRNIRLEARLVDDLLDITRIARGKMEVVLEPMDMHEAIRQAIEISRADIESRKQELTVSLEAGTHKVTGDSQRLQQVVWNLLKNASKFSPEEGRIKLRTRNREGWMVIEVRDRGIGIEKGALERIFDPFEQADGEIARRFGGLGLGLAISKATMAAHGGRLRAESEGAGKGARLIAELPVEDGG